MSKQYEVTIIPKSNTYLAYLRPKLCTCGQLKASTHSCTEGVTITEVYELSHSLIGEKTK